mmetsp:Transcript_59836/g.104648  ORF Transcript_59836/g.104648 Transcript_59836/m.104648 type:complete len:483 (-) Transcript_59836:244-1692(-)
MASVAFYCLIVPLVSSRCTGDAGCTDVQSDHTSMLQSAVMPTAMGDALTVDVQEEQLHAQIHFAKEARLYWDQRLSNSVDFLAAHDTSTDLRSGAAPVAPDVRAMRDQLHASLKLALESRLHWDRRLSELQALRASSNLTLQQPNDTELKETIEKVDVDPAMEDPSLLTEHPIWNVKVSVLCLICILAVIYLSGSFRFYHSSHEETESWYNDSEFLRKVVASTALIWFVVGMVGFSEFFEFTEERRHLTMVESLYLCAQILTTVGYGDFTPSTAPGKAFMVVYSFAGVSIVATLLQEIVFLTMEASAHHVGIQKSSIFGKYKNFLESVVPVIACVAFGTVFFSMHPGEDISSFEALYMSVITLLSIGFGVYHPRTQTGKLVGAIWMVVGVASMGRLIMRLTNSLFQQRKKLCAQAVAQDIFAEVDKKGKGYIDKVEFMEFEMVRSGIPQSVFDEVKEKFASLDKDCSGTLNLEEFQAYVKMG